MNRLAVELGIAVDQRALEAKVADAALELARCYLRVLHWQSGNADKAIGTLGDLVGQHVVRLACHLDGAFDVGDGLDCRRIE